MIEGNKDNNSSLLVRYSLMAFPLAFLGVPLYIHLPKFYHDYYGVSLELLGVILLLSRLLDAFVDPLLGVLSDKFHLTQTKYFIFFMFGLIFFFNAFFYPNKSFIKDFMSLWFAGCTVFIYLFFSLVFINYYNLGLYISREDSLKVKLASFREFSSFLGMIFASIVPFLLVRYFGDESKALTIYGIIFSALLVMALIFLPKISLNPLQATNQNFYANTIEQLGYIFKRSSMRSLILIFFINAIPVAITSNLLTFYVDKVLCAEESMPVFLMIYFLAGTLGACSCSLFFKSSNKINSLLLMMITSAMSFSITYFLGSSTSYIFYFICVMSGFGAGGELVMLSAIAADVLEDHQNYGNTFFALWNSSTKITLAIAAGVFLPLISISDNFFVSISLVSKLKVYYALVPLIIKFIAIVILAKSNNLRG